MNSSWDVIISQKTQMGLVWGDGFAKVIIIIFIDILL